MNAEKAIEYGAMGLAVVAVLYVLRTPGKAVASTAFGQGQDMALANWLGIQGAQAAAADQSAASSLDWMNKRWGLGLSVPAGESIGSRNYNLLDWGKV